jgi:DNA-binding MarR family transcriptional regulator
VTSRDRADGWSEATSLSTLLSQALVAFTIEFDNEAEHRMPHRTTQTSTGGAKPKGPWLVSQVMWANIMRHVGKEGIRIADLHERSHTTHDSLAGLERWGYVTVEPKPTGDRPVTTSGDLVVKATLNGMRAQQVWRPLAQVIEQRWRDRFGESEIEDLRRPLKALVDHFDIELPEYLPITYPTQNGKAELPVKSPTELQAPADPGRNDSDLSVLLSKVLLAFTLDFEQEAKISLVISANTLRVLDEAAVAVRELPRLTGVSKEANAMATGFLSRHGCAVVEPAPTAPRGKVIRLTPKGLKAKQKYLRLLQSTENNWYQRFGDEDLDGLRSSLRRLTDLRPGRETPALFQCIVPYPDNWRASVKAPETLPHYPMVLHRGGYPDGS